MNKIPIVVVLGNDLELSNESRIAKLPDLFRAIPPSWHKLFIFPKEIRNEIASILEFVPEIKLIQSQNRTRGALASLGLGLDLIPEDTPIIIVPTNSRIKFSYYDFLDSMQREGCDAGLISFKSTNPNYSYLRKVNNQITEIAEKKIISDEATAGVFYFINLAVLLDSLSWVLTNKLENNGNYFIAPALNYLITQSMKIGQLEISESDYERITE